jgi:hypothetical protein
MVAKLSSANVVALLCLMVLCSPGYCADILHPLALKTGQKGEFAGYGKAVGLGIGDDYWTAVEEVLSKKEVIIKAGGFEPTGVRVRGVMLRRQGPATQSFILQMDTKDLNDGKAVDLSGMWEVLDKRKIDKKTYFVVGPPAKKK